MLRTEGSGGDSVVVLTNTAMGKLIQQLNESKEVCVISFDKVSGETRKIVGYIANPSVTGTFGVINLGIELGMETHENGSSEPFTNIKFNKLNYIKVGDVVNYLKSNGRK
jgi:hypothetical protein